MLCQQDLSLFWVAMALVVAAPCGVAWWLYRTFPAADEGVSTDEVDALQEPEWKCCMCSATGPQSQNDSAMCVACAVRDPWSHTQQGGER